MKLGTGLGLTNARRRNAGNPLAWLGGTYSALVSYCRSHGLLFQDASRTTPAKDDGDPVHVLVWPYSPNGEFTLQAVGAGSRPALWDRGGGKWALMFDGVDDRLLGNIDIPANSAWSWMWAGNFDSAFVSCRVLQGDVGGEGSVNYDTTQANSHLIFRGSALNTSVHATADPITMVLQFATGGNGVIRIDGYEYANGSVGTRAATQIAIGTGVGGGGPFAGLIDCVIGIKSTSFDIPRAEAYMSSLHARWEPEDTSGLVADLVVAECVAAGTVFQDAAGTAPANQDGDPIYRLTCPRTGLVFQAPSYAARPTLWDLGNGKWGLRTDGTDDSLVNVGTVAIAQPITVASVQNVEAYTTGDETVWDLGSAQVAYRYGAIGSFVDSEIINIGYPPVIGVPHAAVGVFSGMSGRAYLNAGLAATGSTGSRNADRIRIGGRGNGIENFVEMTLSGLLVYAGDRKFSAPTMANWLRQLM